MRDRVCDSDVEDDHLVDELFPGRALLGRGLLQEPGAGNDYTISTNTITYLTAPVSGDKIRVNYRK